MDSALLQIKVDPAFKDKLKRVAMGKGLNLSSFVKSSLMQAVVREDALALTDNGFTQAEEARLLRSIRAGEAEVADKRAAVYQSMEEALNDLE